ncbi:MAG: OmpA family protein [Caenibius sp.]
MPELRIFSSICLAATAAAAGAQTPEAQYTVEDVQDSFSCEAAGRATNPDGTCSTQLGTTRSFQLIKPNATPSSVKDAAPPVRSEPKANVVRKPASKWKDTRVGMAPVADTRRDLLIGFANASAELTEQAKANARVFAQAISSPQLASARFAIDGHTNAVGGREYNYELSLQRANALVNYLESLGVARTRFEVGGFGYARPINPADPAAAENRRVEARRLDQ